MLAAVTELSRIGVHMVPVAGNMDPTVFMCTAGIWDILIEGCSFEASGLIVWNTPSNPKALSAFNMAASWGGTYARRGIHVEVLDRRRANPSSPEFTSYVSISFCRLYFLLIPFSNL